MGRRMLDALKPPSGPYALFHHQIHTLERLRDVRTIVQRMTENRMLLTEAHTEVRKAMPREWPAGVPYPPEVSRVMARASGLTRYRK